MHTYSIFGKSAGTSAAELARICDDGQTITFQFPGTRGWAIDRSTLECLLEKYSRFGYRLNEVSEIAHWKPSRNGRDAVEHPRPVDELVARQHWLEVIRALEPQIQCQPGRDRKGPPFLPRELVDRGWLRPGSSRLAHAAHVERLRVRSRRRPCASTKSWRGIHRHRLGGHDRQQRHVHRSR